MTYRYQAKSGSDVVIKESESLCKLEVDVDDKHFDFQGDNAYGKMMGFLEENNLRRAYDFY